MSHIFRRGRTLAHALIPRPPAVVSHGQLDATFLSRGVLIQSAGLERDVFRGRTVQHRTYSATQRTQQPQTSIAASIAKLPDVPKLAQHLNHVFAPLQFPPELAARILTHQSHKHSALTNNARLSFIGAQTVLSAF